MRIRCSGFAHLARRVGSAPRTRATGHGTVGTGTAFLCRTGDLDDLAADHGIDGEAVRAKGTPLPSRALAVYPARRGQPGPCQRGCRR
jgi:hypothetical protein